MNSNPPNSQDSVQIIPDTDIANAVISLLRSQNDQRNPIYLATLGHRLSSYFRKPLRDILGDRKLRTIIDSAGGKILVDGPGDALRARLSDGVSSSSLSLRYDPAIWAAFAKPPIDGRQRIVNPRRPFDMADHPDGPIPDGWITVDHDLIPPSDMAKIEREETIKRSVKTWCDQNTITPEDLTDLRPRDMGLTRQFRNSADMISSTAALLTLLEHISPDKRAKHMISLEMVYDLLKGGR